MAKGCILTAVGGCSEMELVTLGGRGDARLLTPGSMTLSLLVDRFPTEINDPPLSGPGCSTLPETDNV